MMHDPHEPLQDLSNWDELPPHVQQMAKASEAAQRHMSSQALTHLLDDHQTELALQHLRDFWGTEVVARMSILSDDTWGIEPDVRERFAGLIRQRQAISDLDAFLLVASVASSAGVIVGAQAPHVGIAVQNVILSTGVRMLCELHR